MKLINKSKKELLNEIRALKISRQYWANYCRDLKASLIVLKKQLTKISENIKYDNHNKSRAKITYSK